ncbi:MAG: hypothetical protein ACKVU2_07905 [Saprospiraceae bacterium]
MSTTEAILVIFFLLAGLAASVWVFARDWSPERLPLWASLIGGLMLAMLIVPRFLPASIRWSEVLSVAQGAVGIVTFSLSVKCLILLVRHNSDLSDSQRYAAYLGLAPLIIVVFLVLFFFLMVGAFSSK